MIGSDQSLLVIKKLPEATMKHILMVRIESEAKWTIEQIEHELGQCGSAVKVIDLLDEPAPKGREQDEY